LIAPAIEVAEERVAQIVLPADGIDRVYGRRVPGRIAVAEPTVVAVNRKAQLPRRTPLVGRPALGRLGQYGQGDFPQVGALIVGAPPLRFGSSASFLGLVTRTFVLLEKVLLFCQHFPAKRVLNPTRKSHN
jgi:hypothetical protein